jgi:hypothetical protein
MSKHAVYADPTDAIILDEFAVFLVLRRKDYDAAVGVC